MEILWTGKTAAAAGPGKRLGPPPRALPRGRGGKPKFSGQKGLDRLCAALRACGEAFAGSIGSRRFEFPEPRSPGLAEAAPWLPSSGAAALRIAESMSK